ncbi:hypothetical protein MBLNU457_7062t1 [Dothideomycetes sp. NU457]
MATHTERQFLTSLINTISIEPPPNPTTNNPLKLFSNPDSNIRQIFLTLHILYPNELLPALDLLDRGLIYHLFPTPETATKQSCPPPQKQKRIYHVRSAQEPPSWQRRQQQTHHSHRTEMDDADAAAGADEMRTDVTYYETRPWSWNCTCPAFVFAAFPATAFSSAPPHHHHHHHQHHHQDPVNLTDSHDEDPRAQISEGHDVVGQRKWIAGGLMKGNDAPICRHLLACVLAEHCRALFGRFVKEREVSADEIVAWGAGWGG